MSDEPTTDATHTVIVEREAKSGGGAGWLIGIVLLIALGFGIWYFTQHGSSQTAKDNAIANAANEVGDAAQQVGNAAEDAAGSLKKK